MQGVTRENFAEFYDILIIQDKVENISIEEIYFDSFDLATGKLKQENQLVLHFAKAEPPRKPGSPDPSKRASKGTYFGFNPLMHTLGVVDDVILEHTDGSLMNDIVTDFSLNDSFTEGNVRFAVSGKSRFKTVKIRVRLLGPDGPQVADSTIPTDVKNGVFNVTLQFTVTNPELWWPRGYGEQKLYKAEISLLVQGSVHQEEPRTIGFRKITMPEDLHFLVNGKSVFLRGGDWVKCRQEVPISASRVFRRAAPAASGSRTAD